MAQEFEDMGDQFAEDFSSNREVIIPAWIKNIGSTLLGATGLAYACGFFITNLYLNKYEVYDFSIVNARYIYTGLLFLSLCSIAFIGGLYIEKAFSDYERPLALRITWSFVSWLVLSSVFGLLLKAVFSYINGLGSFLNFPVSFWFYLAIPLFASQINIARRSIEKSDPKGNTFFNSLFWPLPFTWITVIFLASFYALTFYPLLPISLAGGQPSPVKLLINESGLALVEQLVKIDAGNISEVVYLIEKGSDYYYVLAPKDQQGTNIYQSIEIDKALISGVLHPREVSLSAFVAKIRP